MVSCSGGRVAYPVNLTEPTFVAINGLFLVGGIVIVMCLLRKRLSGGSLQRWPGCLSPKHNFVTFNGHFLVDGTVNLNVFPN